MHPKDDDSSFFKDVVEQSPFPILRIHKSGRLLYANTASLPVLLKWNIKVGEYVSPDIIAAVNPASFEKNNVQKIEIKHEKTIVELTFSVNVNHDTIHVFGQDVTTQRLAKQELKKSLESAESIKSSLEQAEMIGKHGSWEIDLKTQEVKISKGLFSVFGLLPPSSPVSLEEFYEMIGPSYRHFFQKIITDAAENQKKETQTHDTITLKNRTKRKIRSSAQIVSHADGTPAKIIGTIQDVTDLVNAQEEARAYKAALDQAASVAITDSSGTITYANDHFSKLSGYSKDFLIGKDHRLIKSGVMTDQFYKTMWETISSGSVWKGEICNRAQSGQLYWMDTVIVPFIGEDGKPEKYMAIRTDVTQRKKAEEDLVRAKEAALNAFQRLEEAEVIGQFGSWELYLNDRSFSCSKGLQRILNGTDDTKPSYNRFLNFVLEEDRGTLEQAMEASLVARQGFACNYRVRLQDNQIKWLRSEGRPTYDQKGNPLKMVGIVQDVTEKIQTEMELTAATLKADAATHAKAEFLANMSHEIRTPMNGVIGMCNLLLTTIHDPTQKSQLKIIQNCGNTLLNLINDILDFSKLEAEKIELENEPFHIHQAAHEVVQLMHARALEKGITLTYTSDPSVPSWFLGDTTRLRQILTNLVSNAIKFTEKGSVTISSKILKIENEKFEIQFSVKDTGIGISEEGKAKLFNSFSQADVSTTRKFGGTGLGLVISKGLCEKMGGRIGLESTPGKGSTFFFTLQLSATQAREEAPENVLLGFDAKMASQYPLNILVAEDNRVNQLIAIGLIEKLGYRPDVAANGLEVLDSLKRKSYDLIFMDYHMPEMDGLEATKKIFEEYPKSQRPAIVALTASAMKDDVDRYLSAGMMDFISKPIQSQEIIRVIHSIVSKTKITPAIPLESDQESRNSKFDQKPVLDVNLFLSHFSGMDDLLMQAIENFLKIKPSLIDDLQKSILNQDSKSLELAAHTLKGMVSNFYAEPSKIAAWELEKIGNSGNFSSAMDAFSRLVSELEKLDHELKKMITQRKAS